MSWAAQGRHRGGRAAGSPEPGRRGAGASQTLALSPGPFFLGPFFSQILLSPCPFLPASLSGPEPRPSPSGIPSHSGKARSSRFTGVGKAAPAPEDCLDLALCSLGAGDSRRAAPGLGTHRLGALVPRPLRPADPGRIEARPEAGGAPG